MQIPPIIVRILTGDNPRENIKSMRDYTKEERDAQIAAQVDKFSKEIYGGNYEYQNMKEILGTVKAHNPNTKFYIFTTPVSEPLSPYDDSIRAMGRL